MILVRYSGPPRGVHLLATELESAGFRAEFVPPAERRGVGPEIVHVLLRIESDVESGLVGGAAFAAVQRLTAAYKRRHPGAQVTVDQSGETEQTQAENLGQDENPSNRTIDDSEAQRTREDFPSSGTAQHEPGP